MIQETGQLIFYLKIQFQLCHSDTSWYYITCESSFQELLNSTGTDFAN